MGVSRVLNQTARLRARLGSHLLLAALPGAVACTKPTDVVPVASIQLQPGLDSIEVGETYSNWIITLRDANGNTLTGRQLTWESLNLAVATISSTGAVSGIGTGSSSIVVQAEGKSAQATIKVNDPIVSIVATPDSFDLPLTTSRTIDALVLGPGGTALVGRRTTWASADLTIATVNANGLVTPIALGTTTVTVFAGNKQAQVRVRVVAEPVTSVRITPQQSVHIVRLGQAVQLGAECLNANQQVLAGRAVTWNSSNPLTASVGTQSGLVTGVSLGTANITATCENVNATVVAQVTPIPVSTVTLAPVQMLLNVGQQGQFAATARDSANNILSLVGRQVTFTSDNLPVATISNQGVVSGVSPGISNIQVSVDGVLSAQAPVTVQLVPVAIVTVNVPADVKVGEQRQMGAQCRDAQGNVLTGRVITWATTNGAIATINSVSGIAIGTGVGTVQINATCEGVVGFANLTVIP